MIRIAAAALAAALACASSPALAGAAAFTDPTDNTILDAGTHPRAFPSALGFGKTASVRDPNAVVYMVNSGLDTVNEFDSAVTFRECVEARAITYGPILIPAGRPRYCLFNYTGYIRLTSPLVATTPKLYIAGQTAPSDGVEITLDLQNYVGPPNAILNIKTDDVVIQHVRFRGGPHPSNDSDNLDGIRLTGAKRVMIDHVSIQYTTDEALDIYGGEDVTVSNSILGPMLCGTPGPTTVGHAEDEHCRIFHVNPGKNVTITHNLIVYGEMRGFNVTGGRRDPATEAVIPDFGQIDVVNNLIYFFRSEAGLVANRYGETYANIIGNTMWRGPRYVAAATYPIALYNKDAYGGGIGGANTGFAVYHSGNRTFRSTIGGLTGQANPATYCGIVPASNPPVLDCSVTGLSILSTTTPAIAPGNAGLSLDALDIVASTVAEKTILNFAGAKACRNSSVAYGFMNCRNEIDTAIVNDYSTCQTAPQAFSAGWTISRGTPFGNDSFAASFPAQADTDRDGMFDAFENLYPSATNVAVKDGNVDADGDGYHNIEEMIAGYGATASWYNAHRAGLPWATIPPTNCGWTVNP